MEDGLWLAMALPFAMFGGLTGMFMFDVWRPGGLGGRPGALADDPAIFVWVGVGVVLGAAGIIVPHLLIG